MGTMPRNQQMKDGVIFPQTECGTDVEAIGRFVRTVEAMGFHHLFVADHVLGADLNQRRVRFRRLPAGAWVLSHSIAPGVASQAVPSSSIKTTASSLLPIAYDPGVGPVHSLSPVKYSGTCRFERNAARRRWREAGQSPSRRKAQSAHP